MKKKKKKKEHQRRWGRSEKHPGSHPSPYEKESRSTKKNCMLKVALAQPLRIYLFNKAVQIH